MANYELDKLVMLLSSDWFLPHWHSIGISVEQEKQRCLRDGCREIVRQMMVDAEEYWHIDFSDERVHKTRSAFDALLKTCKAEKATIECIRWLISGAELPIDEGTRWLLVSMTVFDGPPLDGAAAEALATEWKHLKGLWHANFDTPCLTSTTNWDQYLRSTTPELPNNLASYVAVIVTDRMFETLWGFIKARLTVKQRSELLSWYRSLGESRVGEPLRLPDDS